MGSRTVYLLAGISVAILVIANVIILTSAAKASSISFGGISRLSVFNEKLTVITSDHDGDSNAAIWIHGSDNISNASISFSNLVDDNSGETISSDLINTSSSGEINGITNKAMKKVTVSVNSINNTPGVYQGSLFIESGTNKTSIPFTFDLKPNLSYIIIFVVDGIAISILAWKFIIYHNHKAINSRIVKRKEELTSSTIPNPTLKDVMNDPNINLRAVSFEHYLKNKPTYNTERLNFKKYVDNASIPERITSETVQIIGTVFFGVGVSVLGLLNNSYIISLHDITIQEALVLIGLGLGIGSLKDFTQQLSERREA